MVLFSPFYNVYCYFESLLNFINRCSAIDAVNKDFYYPSPAFQQFFNDFHSTISVLHRCTLNNNSQYQSKGINNDMPLNAFYLLTGLKSLTFTAYKGILYRLSIYNIDGWLLIFTLCFTYLFLLMFVYLFNQQSFLPRRKVVINNIPVWKISRQHPPLASGFNQIQYSMDYFPQLVFPTSFYI